MEPGQPDIPHSDPSREHDAQEPREVEVRAQLKRILSSAAFNAPERLRRFLLYIVGETLAGRSQRIKGYSVAVEVFGRPESQDTQNDPVVRIEAGRLRCALERYYLMVGGSDPILIDIPKGGYVPRFLQQGPQDTSEVSQPEPGRKGGLRRALLLSLRAPLPAALTLATIIAIVAAPQIGTQLPHTIPVIGAASPPGPSVIVRPFVNVSGVPEEIGRAHV